MNNIVVINADTIGNRITHVFQKMVLEIIHSGHEDDKYTPPPFLLKMIDLAKLGVKSGIGFYNYTKDPKNLSVDYKG